jgi:hypothetical protein
MGFDFVSRKWIEHIKLYLRSVIFILGMGKIFEHSAIRGMWLDYTEP